MTPTVSLSPNHGQAGTVVTVTGSGFSPGSLTALSFSSFEGDPPGTPIEVWAETTDGSGNVVATVAIPHGLFAASIDYFVYLTDADANQAVASFFLCGGALADGITIEAGGPFATGGTPIGGPPPTNVVLDYIFFGGSHWVLWQDASQIGHRTTFPPPANHALNATQISADGSTVTDYPIDTNYRWNFDGELIDDPGFHNTRFCGSSPESSPVWQYAWWFSSWDKPIYDARFATDGTNLWVGVVTAETLIYPWLDNSDGGTILGLGDTATNPGSLNQFIDLATLTAGYTAFPTNLGGAVHRYITNTFGVFWAGRAFPVSDAGDNNSGYWSPPCVVMFSFDGAAFNRIGQIAAFYCPGLTSGYDNANDLALIGGQPVTLQPYQDGHNATPRGSFYSRISLAADPSQPGICHAVWSEGGPWGRCGSGDPCAGRYVWDGGPANLDYRINYTTWSPTAKLTDTDIATSHIDRTNAQFPFTIGSERGDCGYTWPEQAGFAATGLHDLRNDSGKPLLFIAFQQSIQNCFNPNSSTYGPPPWTPNDGVGNPWLDYDLVFADTLHIYDLSSGSPVLLRSITSDLFPDEAEAEFFYPTSLYTPPNYTTPFASDCLFAAVETQGDLGRTRQGVVDRGFAISDIYDDPLVGDLPVYLVNVPWAKRWPTGDNYATNAGPGAWWLRGIYRVPTDGSAVFDFLDGERQVGFSVMQLGDAYAPFGDFFSDPRDIWSPTRVAVGGLSSGKAITYSCEGGVMFDRICLNEWAPYSSVEVPFGTAPAFAPVVACPGFHYDPDADSFTYVAAGDGTTKLFEVVTLFICRRCRNCQCGPGLHLSHRF